MSNASRFWLLKTEPETYSFGTLLQEGKTNWNDVRNFQARNYLKEAELGDLALIYHSGKTRAVVGIAKVVRTAYPDRDPETPDQEWVQIDLSAVRELREPVTLAQLKKDRALSTLPLIKQSRLSVMPITANHYLRILELGGDSA